MTAHQIVASLLEDERSGKIVLAVLTEASHRALLEAYPPVHENVYAHHLTMAYDAPLGVHARFAKLEGRTLKFMVLGVAQDERGQAVVVYGHSTNPVPHVTISTASGTPPEYSNDLLARGWEPAEHRLELEGVVTIEELS